MRRLLLTIFLSTGIISASAAAATPVSTNATRLNSAPVAALNLQPHSDRSHTSASQHAATDQTVAVNSVAAQSSQTDSDWRYRGTLLTTLVLIGVIAVRRNKAGRR